MINDIGILRYAEEGAMQELSRRSDLARKHGYAPMYVENMNITLANLEKIRNMIDEIRMPTRPAVTNGGVSND